MSEESKNQKWPTVVALVSVLYFLVSAGLVLHSILDSCLQEDVPTNNNTDAKRSLESFSDKCSSFPVTYIYISTLPIAAALLSVGDRWDKPILRVTGLYIIGATVVMFVIAQVYEWIWFRNITLILFYCFSLLHMMMCLEILLHCKQPEQEETSTSPESDPELELVEL